MAAPQPVIRVLRASMKFKFKDYSDRFCRFQFVVHFPSKYIADYFANRKYVGIEFLLELNASDRHGDTVYLVGDSITDVYEHGQADYNYWRHRVSVVVVPGIHCSNVPEEKTTVSCMAAELIKLYDAILSCPVQTNKT
jgi:hypothetical protein